MFNLLDQPEIKQCINSILESKMPSDEKIKKISMIMDMDKEFGAKLQEHQNEIISGSPDQRTILISTIAMELGIWDPERIIEKVENSIRRAVNRLLKSQNPDGGWGVEWQISKYWETAWAILSINAADEIIPLDKNLISGSIKNGVKYFRNNDSGWSTKGRSPDQEFSNYDLPLVLRTLFTFKNDYSRDLVEEIEKTLKVIISRQNVDGGWNQNINVTYRSPSIAHDVNNGYSDVSPTSQILQTICCINPKTYRLSADRALNWIVENQNTDGSWDLGSKHPGKGGIYCTIDGILQKGRPIISKTCDGLQGIFAWNTVEDKNTEHTIIIPSSEELGTRIEKAVRWIQMKEEPIFNPEQEVCSWSGFDYTNTCIALEALVNHPDATLPLRTSNALWLIDNQICRQNGDDDDGKWPFEQTPRISYSLIKFLKTIKNSPFFKAA